MTIPPSTKLLGILAMYVMKRKLISLYKILIGNLKRQDFIESITLIGDPVEKGELDKIVDVDIVIIVKKPMSIEKYNKIENIYESICKEFTTSKLDVLYTIA